jgi:hypothetical protein
VRRMVDAVCPIHGPVRVESLPDVSREAPSNNRGPGRTCDVRSGTRARRGLIFLVQRQVDHVRVAVRHPVRDALDQRGEKHVRVPWRSGTFPEPNSGT